jgi:ribA/ribD-fused uncharacterized protein
MIPSFKGEHAFLSNFHPSPIFFEGINFPTVEHAFQAAKTDDQETRQKIADKETPGKAKRAGGRRGILKNFDQAAWETKKLATMEALLRLKFAIPELAKLLQDTGDQDLVEGNAWNDTFWGVCRGNGQNNLGKLLMQIRAE